MNTQRHQSNRVMLDPEATGSQAQEFETKLRSLIIGQEPAVSSLTSIYQVFQAGLTNATRPLGALLFLGPTGSGKTRVVEAAAEILFNDPKAVIKIDCAEYQEGHEIAKLVGSPPGYLGHRETVPLLTQENLDRHQTEENKLTLVLFDEIEKASDTLWQLLLGILDKATLTLGNNRKVDFSRCIIFLTSNLGAREMSEMMTGSIGFVSNGAAGLAEVDLEQKLHRAALEAARRKFSPEFMNRIDKTVVFSSLGQEQLGRIIDLELHEVQQRIDRAASDRFTFTLTDQAKQLILAEGTDYRYGARHLKRAVERLLVHPLANLSASRQVRAGDQIVVDYDEEQTRLIFCVEKVKAVAATGALKLCAPTGRLSTPQTASASDDQACQAA